MATDMGRLVGRYLQSLAWLDIAVMVLIPLLFDAFYLDLTFIFLFWAAAYLMNHSRTAWKWVIGVSAVHVALGLGLLAYAGIVGPGSVPLEIGARPLEDPSWLLVASVPVGLIVLAGIPFVLLLTPKARREFARPATPASS